jgi:hypothetical protein
MAAMLKLVHSIAGAARARMTYQPHAPVVRVPASSPVPIPGVENVRYDVAWAIWANARHPDAVLSVRSYPVELPPWT